MELLTCPCCGGMAQIEIAAVTDESAVRCLDCGLQIKRPSIEGLAAVISAWNRRVSMGFRKLDPRQ